MWQGEGFTFDRQTIATVVAPSPGVYLLWNAEQWIYVGESQDLRGRLLAHLDGVDARIAQSSPTAFGFELHFLPERCTARRNELVRALQPACNVSHPTVPRLPVQAQPSWAPLSRRHYTSAVKNRA